MASASLHWYFAYGSNMARSRLEQRVGRCVAVGHGWLDGFALRFHKRGRDGSGKCDAYATGDPGDMLHGVIYGMSADQREALHGFEGPDYAVHTISAVHRDGPVQAFLYVARAHAIDAGLVPFDWYKAYVAAGAREAMLPDAYRARIAAQPARPDPDRTRASANRVILRSAASQAPGEGL